MPTFMVGSDEVAEGAEVELDSCGCDWEVVASSRVVSADIAAVVVGMVVGYEVSLLFKICKIELVLRMSKMTSCLGQRTLPTVGDTTSLIHPKRCF